MSIYDDVRAAQQLIEECCDLTTGEVLDDSQMAQAQELKNNILSFGLETLCKVRANKQADIESLKAEEKRIADKRKKLESQFDNLNDYIYTIYQQGDDVTQQAGTFTVSTRKSTQVLVDEDIFADDRFTTYVEEKHIDKNALKKALTAGEVITGAKLQTNYNLQVK